MKFFIAFTIILGVSFVGASFVGAVPRGKGIVEEIECWICHSLGPHLEAFADEEAEITEEFLKKECRLLGPVVEHYCDDWFAKHLDPLIQLLKADECMSACFACDAILKCGSADCKPSCGRPSCTGCSH